MHLVVDGAEDLRVSKIIQQDPLCNKPYLQVAWPPSPRQAGTFAAARQEVSSVKGDSVKELRLVLYLCLTCVEGVVPVRIRDMDLVRRDSYDRTWFL